MATNPCCKYRNKSGVFKGDEKGDQLTAPGPNSDPLDVKMYKIYIALRGSTNNEQAIKVLKTLTPEERCYICRRNKDFKDGSFMSYVQDDITFGLDNTDLAKAFHKYLKCPEFGRSTFTAKPGNEKGELDKLNDEKGFKIVLTPGLIDFATEAKCEAVKDTSSFTTISLARSKTYKNLCDIILAETIKSYLL